jgi:Family of unknown function (DUF5681)
MRDAIMTHDQSDYAIGYGKPPRHTQFKRGQSGNPKGRAKGSKNLATLIMSVLNERVIITENGRRRGKRRGREAATRSRVS